MTERERLIELLLEHTDNAFNISEDKHFVPSTTIGKIADTLLANGVIVPPFAIGAKLYAVITNMPFVPADVYECEVVWYALDKDGIRPTVEIKSDNILNGANLGLYPEDLFLTKEEAIQALKGGGKE